MKKKILLTATLAAVLALGGTTAAYAATKITFANAHNAAKSAWVVKPLSQAPKKACGGTAVSVSYTGVHYGSFTEYRKGGAELLHKYANGSTCVSTTLGKR